MSECKGPKLAGDRMDPSSFLQARAGQGMQRRLLSNRQRHAHRATELKFLVVKADTQARWRHEWSKFAASWACGQGMAATR